MKTKEKRTTPKKADIGKTDNVPGLLSARGVTLKQIRYFLAVAYNGAVTSAAHDIYISPASITEAVQNLEKTLGVALFERSQGGMSLTREGDRFRGYCEKILFLLEDAMRAVHKPSAVEGDLRMAASPVVLGYFLPPLISRFQRMFPGVRLNLLELSRAEIEKKVAGGALDIGMLLISNVSKDGEFQKRKLFSSERFLWCAAGHPFASQKSVSLDDIASEPYIQLIIDEAEENTKQFWKKHGARPKTILRTESPEAVRGYVGQGAGVTILSEVLFRPWSLDGDRLIAKSVSETVPNMDIGMIWSRGEAPPPVGLFLNFMSFYGRSKNTANIRKNRRKGS